MIAFTAKYFDFSTVPLKSWARLRFTSKNGQRRIAEQYTGRITFVHSRQTQELHNDQPRGNYNENMNQLMWCNMTYLHDLVEKAITVTSSMTGVDYNDDNDHEDNASMPSLLVSEPQEFFRPPLNSISIFDADEKAKAGCG